MHNFWSLSFISKTAALNVYAKAANEQIVTNSKIRQNDRNIPNFCRDVNIQDNLEDVSYLQEPHVLEHEVRPATLIITESEG